MALTVKGIAKLSKSGRYGDGKGLYLEIAAQNVKKDGTPGKPGARGWVFRYERADTRPGREGKRRERWMWLGSLDTFTLEEARERARKARQMLTDGIDPLEAKDAERGRGKTGTHPITFEEAADKYFDQHKGRWTNKKGAAQFHSSLKAYVFPIFGKEPVAAVNRAMVLRALDPIWNDKRETANRVRGRIESILDFAKSRDWRTAPENPAAWAGNLKHTYAGPKKTNHHAALNYKEVPAFFESLVGYEGISARALELTILTAARTNEIIGARWSEIDFDEKVWIIPAARMKLRKEHRIPLCDRALALLAALPREGDWVFPGRSENRHISSMAMLQCLARMGRTDFTVHGFRSSFRDWAAEKTDYQNHIVEMALAHAISSAVEASYRRGDLVDKRRGLMNDWARFCERPTTTATDNVTSIHKRA